MKVTVCFGGTGIVVPCKQGQLRVRELSQQALARYLRAREKVGRAGRGGARGTGMGRVGTRTGRRQGTGHGHGSRGTGAGDE